MFKPLTLKEFAEKRNEIAEGYGNKTMPPYMWKKDYEGYYLNGFKNNDPTIMSVYHEQTRKEGSRQFKLSVDMDGVLCDFDQAVKNLGPGPAMGLGENAKPEAKQEMYKAIENAGSDFWALMPWMPDGKALWNWISQFNPVLLTSPGKFRDSIEGKKMWIKNNIPGITAFFSEEKWEYAQPNSILIDDKPENVGAWESKRGIGILHTDTASTKEKLLAAIKRVSPTRAEKILLSDILRDLASRYGSLVEVGVHKWLCDNCKKIEYSKRVPEGWAILDRNFVRKEIEHLCKDCAKKVK